jgi:predicted GTPase
MRTHVLFVGRRAAGKSSLVNGILGSLDRDSRWGAMTGPYGGEGDKEVFVATTADGELKSHAACPTARSFAHVPRIDC